MQVWNIKRTSKQIKDRKPSRIKRTLDLTTFIGIVVVKCTYISVNYVQEEVWRIVVLLYVVSCKM